MQFSTYNVPDVSGKCCLMTFPLTQRCMATFKNGSVKAFGSKFTDFVRHQLRQDLGRDQQSTVAIADSQSVKTTEKKGRSTVSMVVRRLKGVSAISS